MPHSCSFIWATWLIHMCIMRCARLESTAYCAAEAHTSLVCVWDFRRVGRPDDVCAWHDSFICVTSLIQMRSTLPHSTIQRCVFQEPWRHVCATWFIRVCIMTHSCVWLDIFIGVKWLNYVCDMTRSCVRHDKFMCHNSVIVRRDSFICATWCIYIWRW